MKLQDLENYRNNEGFIDFDKVLELYEKGKIDGFQEGLPETRGSNEKFKHWFELEDCDILVRSTMFTEEMATYTEYAELIVEELANQIGIPCAHYDLIKINGIEGNLSVNMVEDSEKQSLTALSQNQASLDVMKGSTFDEVIEKINYFGNMQGIGRENIKRINKEFVKRVIFDIFTMQTDRHLGNVSLLYDGGEMKLSPIYDNECSLMLDQTRENIKEILSKDNKEKVIETYASLQEGCIGLSSEDRNNEYTGWEDMLYFLCDDSEFAFEFATQCYKKLDIQKAVENVEKRIGCKIPKEAKEYTTLGFNIRKSEIGKGLMIDFEDIGGFENYEDDDEYPI